jgi:hypothetical protein
MHALPSRRVLIAAAAVAFAAGCSNNSASLAPGQSSSLVPSSHQAPAGMRMLPGPAVVGPIFVPLVPRHTNAPRGWPAKKKKVAQILFVSNASADEVEMYDPKTPNPSPEGSITSGLSTPFGLAVDTSGSLYVANLGNSSVTVYKAGTSSPSLTITDGIDEPYDVTVDSSGDVFVSNLGNNTIVAYKSGATSPYESINFNSYGQAVGIGVDGGNNVWVGCDTTSSVYEIPKGSTTPKDANLSGLNGTIDVSFGKKDVMYVSNFGGSNVTVYTYGTTSPSTTITDGIEKNGPTFNGFTKSGYFFQTNQEENVVGYMKNKTSPFSTISGLSDPAGVASSPLVKK